MIIIYFGKLFEEDPTVFIPVSFIVMALFISIFYFINHLLKDRRRNRFIAFILSTISPGSGFAYRASFIRAWLVAIVITEAYIYGLRIHNKCFAIAYAILLFGQPFWAASYADKAGRKLKQKYWSKTKKSADNAYLTDIMPYIHSQHHLAVDTNFLMHFENVLVDLAKNTNVHLFLHPTVFSELEGLKKNRNRETRKCAQAAFDILEIYQKANRMQWTRRPRQGNHFHSSNQRIISGVLGENQNGVKLVFVSHDKGARILARSLNIPVVDPLGVSSNSKKTLA